MGIGMAAQIKREKYDKREKKPPKNFPSSGCKIDFFFARGVGKGRMFYLHNIYNTYIYIYIYT